MVIVTIVWVRIFIAPIVLQQFLQISKWRIVLFLAVTAILDIQVLSAFDAETLAVWIVQRLDRKFQQGIFADQGGHINVCVVRYEKLRLAH